MILTLVTLVLLAAALAGCLIQFLVLKKEIWRLTINGEAAYSRLAGKVAGLEKRLEDLHSELEGQACFQGAPDNGSINFTRRTRALRLHRRGDRPDQIAAALSLPQNEVALLLKLEGVTADAVPQQPWRDTGHIEPAQLGDHLDRHSDPA